MPRTPTGSKSTRYHFTVPEADTEVNEWAKLQYSFSTSVRVAIKEYIARHGMTDAGCDLISRVNVNPEVREVRAAKPEPTEKTDVAAITEIKTAVAENIEKPPTVKTDSHDDMMDDMLADLMK